MTKNPPQCLGMLTLCPTCKNDMSKCVGGEMQKSFWYKPVIEEEDGLVNTHGKYELVANVTRLQFNAKAVVLLVLEGSSGTDATIVGNTGVMFRLPEQLRDLAKKIEAMQ